MDRVFGAIGVAVFSFAVVAFMWFGALHPEMVNKDRVRQGFNPLSPRSMRIAAIVATAFAVPLNLLVLVAAVW